MVLSFSLLNFNENKLKSVAVLSVHKKIKLTRFTLISRSRAIFRAKNHVDQLMRKIVRQKFINSLRSDCVIVSAGGFQNRR